MSQVRRDVTSGSYVDNGIKPAENGDTPILESPSPHSRRDAWGEHYPATPTVVGTARGSETFFFRNLRHVQPSPKRQAEGGSG